jgi:hypothetical protein
MFKRVIVKNIRHLSSNHSHSIIPSNLENKTRNKTLESIIEGQNKTIELIYEEKRKAFEKGFLVGFFTPTVILYLMKSMYIY